MSAMAHMDASLFAQLRRLPALRFAERMRGVLRRPLDVTRANQCADVARRVFAAADEPLRTLYLAKLDEYETQLACIVAQQGGDHTGFVAAACALFPVPPLDPRALPPRAPSTSSDDEPRVIDATTIGELATRVAAHHGFTVDVRFTDHGHARVTRRGTRSTLHVPHKKTFSTRTATRLLVHEIEVHALRTHHAAQQPLALLTAGTARYLATEEGLAMHLAQPWQGRATPGVVSTRAVLAGKSPKEGNGIGMLRRHVYYTGRLQVAVAIARDPSALGMLFVGHVGVDDITTLRTLGIAPAKPPELVSEHVVLAYKESAGN